MRQTMQRYLLAALLSAALLLPLTPFAAGQADGTKPIAPADKQQVLLALTGIIEKDAFVPNVDFTEWHGFLDKQRQAIDKADTQGEFGAAVQKALNSFGFSHFYLMTPQMVESREKHRVVGIGIMIAPDPDGVGIARVYPGSPADMAGLVPGDVIVAVEGKKAATSAPIRGDAGTDVHIEVVHADGRHQKYTLERASYSTAEPASLHFADADTAVIRIPTFDVSYDRRLVEGLMKKATGAKNLVVDLRNNPGGAVVSMLHFMGLVLKDDTTIGTFINSSSVQAYQKTHPGPVDILKVAASVPIHLHTSRQSVPYFKGTLAVLINGGSGSAAEMTAAALHDLRGATVVGTKSAGAVLISVLRPLPDGFRLQFPLADYVTSNGVRLEGHGVIPDFTVKDPRFPGKDKDEPLDRAVAIMEKLDAQRAALAPAA
ncbi:MAG: S41 family peptidase [Fimbriimonadaceae bacterium]